jgi:hypothetical protein
MVSALRHVLGLSFVCASFALGGCTAADAEDSREAVDQGEEDLTAAPNALSFNKAGDSVTPGGGLAGKLTTDGKHVLVSNDGGYVVAFNPEPNGQSGYDNLRMVTLVPQVAQAGGHDIFPFDGAYLTKAQFDNKGNVTYQDFQANLDKANTQLHDHAWTSLKLVNAERDNDTTLVITNATNPADPYNVEFGPTDKAHPGVSLAIRVFHKGKEADFYDQVLHGYTEVRTGCSFTPELKSAVVSSRRRVVIARIAQSAVRDGCESRDFVYAFKLPANF